MSDTETTSWIAALERARAELESALAADPRWRALREAGAEGGRAEEEQALAGSPVYRCWLQLNGAIEKLRRKSRAGPAPAGRRIALRDILERIRSDPALQGAGPQAAAPDREQTEPARTAASGAEPAPSQALNGPATTLEGRADDVPMQHEEATVSFVIREPPRPAPAVGQGEPSGPKEPAPPAPAEADAAVGVEAEVIIVARPR